jgi:hypothetical protein
MNATDSVCAACATFRATVDLPDPDPPAIPMISGFIEAAPPGPCAGHVGEIRGRIEGVTLSQSGIGSCTDASFCLCRFDG